VETNDIRLTKLSHATKLSMRQPVSGRMPRSQVETNRHCLGEVIHIPSTKHGKFGCMEIKKSLHRLLSRALNACVLRSQSRPETEMCHRELTVSSEYGMCINQQQMFLALRCSKGFQTRGRGRVVVELHKNLTQIKEDGKSRKPVSRHILTLHLEICKTIICWKICIASLLYYLFLGRLS
jgi:hypothetical protein